MATMEQLAPWLQTHFVQLWFFSLGWVIVVCVLSAWRRRRRGLPIFRPHFSHAAFEEQWCSGGRGLLWARNCVWISLLPDRLVTGLHFPFHLLFPHRWLVWAGLDNRIALQDVLSAEEATGIAGDCVRISYRGPSGPESFQLVVGKRDRLLRVLRSEVSNAERSNKALQSDGASRRR
jgi:hypothetical protein